MENKDLALREIVRLAKFAAGGDPAYLRAVAIAVLEAGEAMEDSATGDHPSAPPRPRPQQHRTAQPEPLPQPAPQPATRRKAISSHAAAIDRAIMAEKLSQRLDAPHAIVVDLASDEFPIAYPLLRSCPALTQEDLASIVIRQSREHVLTITRRWDVGPQLADTLISYGSEEILDAVLENSHAQISPRTLSNLGAQASTSVELQGKLLKRNDLPVDLITDMLDTVFGELRDQLLAKLIRVTTGASRQKIRIPMRARQSLKFIDASQLAQKLARRRGLNETILGDLASDKKQLELLMCCAQLFEIDLNTSLGLLADKTGLSLATFCRAKQLNMETFSQIMVAQNAVEPESAPLLSILHFYRRLSVPDAMRAIELWREKQDGNAKKEEKRLSA